MNLSALENEIVEKLKEISTIDNLVIQLLPNRNADYKKVYDKPTATVMFSQIKFDKPKSDSPFMQPYTANLEIIISSKGVRSDVKSVGVYEIYMLILQRIIGYQPENYSKIAAVDFKFENYEENVFTYCLSIETESLTIEQTDCIQKPLLVQVDYDIQ